MPEKQQLKGFSDFVAEPFNIGLPSDNLDEVLELGHMMATSRPGLIVFLQPWKESDDTATKA